MYYGMISIAVFMFSLQFYCNQQFEKENGCSLGASMSLGIYSNTAALLVLLIINRFRWEFTPFTFIMALAETANTLLYTLCSMRALSKINLSLYSVFSMLGGMAIPFAAGILFHHEPLTLGKGLCFILVAVSLAFTVQSGKSKGGWIYYAGIFILNGMSGEIAKLFNDAPYPKTSAAGFSVLSCTVTVAASCTILALIKNKPSKPSVRSLFTAGGAGALNRVANWLLLIALTHLPASAQYPFITGGVMVCSTLLCCFTADKPKKSDWAAVWFSFAGILALILIPT